MLTLDEFKQRAAKIKLFILDVDGVLTDGKLYFSATGESMKVFHVLDGLGLKMLQNKGLLLAVISGRQSDAVTKRMQELKIEYVYQNISDKFVIFQQLLQQLNISADEVMAIGDDLPDLAILQHVGLAIAVANAQTEVKNKADWITEKKGGEGAVREICDLILMSQST